MESTSTKTEMNTTSKRWRFPKLELPFGQKSAKIHVIETRERYWILRREIEHYIDRSARVLEISDWRLDKNSNDDESIRSHIASNQLYYISFAGFTGGIFSLMMEFQPRNELPGDEIYTSWYYRTRPVIGAFGAMVMYIIIVSPAFSGSLGSIISKEIFKELTSQPLSSTGFTFGFITGFTERIILPKLI